MAGPQKEKDLVRAIVANRDCSAVKPGKCGGATAERRKFFVTGGRGGT
jgi:hypothetical protein